MPFTFILHQNTDPKNCVNTITKGCALSKGNQDKWWHLGSSFALATFLQKKISCHKSARSVLNLYSQYVPSVKLSSFNLQVWLIQRAIQLENCNQDSIYCLFYLSFHNFALLIVKIGQRCLFRFKPARHILLQAATSISGAPELSVPLSYTFLTFISKQRQFFEILGKQRPALYLQTASPPL